MLDSITRWWVQPDGWRPVPADKRLYHSYYYWYATALRRNFAKTGNTTALRGVLPRYRAQFEQFATGALPSSKAQVMVALDEHGSECLFNAPGNDAQEGTISGPGCRPLVQGTLYGEAAALAEMFAAVGDAASAAQMHAEADTWQRRVLQQWNANLSSFDTIWPAVEPMPPGWTVVPGHNATQCNATFLSQSFDRQLDCAKRCIADANCHFMTYNPRQAWCQTLQSCSTAFRPAGGEGIDTLVTWQKPTAPPPPPTPTPTPAPPAGFSPPLAGHDGTFCCDQTACAGGQSSFLFAGVLGKAACFNKCAADPRCRYVTVHNSGAGGDYCMNAQWCNATNPYAGEPAGDADTATSAKLAPGGQGGSSGQGSSSSSSSSSSSGPDGRTWTFAGVRELASLTSPWMFGAVPRENASVYAGSWDTAFDAEGLGGPHGLRTAEKRHPGYFCDAGCCSWAGPVWPYESSKAITAAINVLNNYPTVTTMDGGRFWAMLFDYTAMHTPKWKVMSSRSTFYANLTESDVAQFLIEGLGELWVAENGCGDDQWTKQPQLGGPAWTDTATNGYRYNHATFMDLVLSGVVGLQPAPNGSLTVNPLVPAATLPWWAADGVALHGKIVSVVFDADGSHYNQGAGIKVLVNGATAASSPVLEPLTVQL